MAGTASIKLGRTQQPAAEHPRRKHSIWFSAAAIALAVAHDAPAQDATPATESPNRIVEQAERAISDDSGPATAARWQARVSRDSNDRLARFGVAMVALLTNDSAGAARGFRGLEEESAQDHEAARIAAYARWGDGSLFYSLGRWADAARSFADAAAAMRALNDSVGEALSLIQLAWLETRAHRPTATAHSRARRFRDSPAGECVARRMGLRARGDVERRPRTWRARGSRLGCHADAPRW